MRCFVQARTSACSAYCRWCCWVSSLGRCSCARATCCPACCCIACGMHTSSGSSPAAAQLYCREMRDINQVAQATEIVANWQNGCKSNSCACWHVCFGAVSIDAFVYKCLKRNMRYSPQEAIPSQTLACNMLQLSLIFQALCYFHKACLLLARLLSPQSLHELISSSGP